MPIGREKMMHKLNGADFDNAYSRSHSDSADMEEIIKSADLASNVVLCGHVHG